MTLSQTHLAGSKNISHLPKYDCRDDMQTWDVRMERLKGRQMMRRQAAACLLCSMFPLFTGCSHLENQDKWNLGLYRNQCIVTTSTASAGNYVTQDQQSVILIDFDPPGCKCLNILKCYILNWPWEDAGTIHICRGTSDEHKILGWRLQMIF